MTTNGINYMHTMKTAISVEDRLLQEADLTARQMGLSRSRLFSVAVEEYMRRRRQEQMLAQLNQVYSGEPDPMAARIKTRFRKVIQDRW